MARTLGLGTVAKYDANDDANVSDTITLLVTGTPPPRVRERVNGATLGDTLSVDGMGIEQVSDYTFTLMVEPNDTQHASFHSIFGAKTALLWQVVFTSSDVMQFEGILAAIEPQGIVKDQYYQEQYTVTRTGAISWS